MGSIGYGIGFKARLADGLIKLRLLILEDSWDDKRRVKDFPCPDYEWDIG